jgi:hypothetical protein
MATQGAPASSTHCARSWRRAATDVVNASGAAGVEPSEGFVRVDALCLGRCGVPEPGAPGDGLPDLPNVFKVMAGYGKW